MKKQLFIAIRSSLIFWGSWSCALAREPLPCAPQVGPSCAFFGNVPALTLHSGVDIAQSLEFIRPIYGLHRGDFKFQSAFQKKKFFELFGIPYSVHEIDHPQASEKELLDIVGKIITNTFDLGLQKGQIFSLRSSGVFGGPHNTLLLGKKGDTYQVHDPYPGIMRFYSKKQLAEKILVRSTKSKRELQARYVTHFLCIEPPNPKPSGIRTVKSLPGTLHISFTSSQRAFLQSALTMASPPTMQTKKDWTKIYPLVDFAMLPAANKTDLPLSVIPSKLKPNELIGLIRLAQFHANVWQLKNRDLLPILFLDGKAQTLIGYRNSNRGLMLIFDNGHEISERSMHEAMKAMHQEEILFATLRVPHQQK